MDSSTQLQQAGLECPLCCNETFSSPDALKYHLLSIIDNLICPACGDRFDKIHELAEHIGNKCEKGEEEEESNVSPVKVEALEFTSDDIEKSILAKALLQKSNGDDLLEKEVMEGEEEGEVINASIIDGNHIQIDECEGNEEGTPMEIQILHTSKEGEGGEEEETVVQIQEVQEGEQVEVNNKNEGGGEENEEELFYCSSCMVSFTSLNDHLQEYHEGQTVFIEDGQNESEEVEKQDEKSFYVVEGKDGETMEIEDTNSNIEIPVENADFNTIQEEACIDKDGRLYTRKVVQIEKFWDETTEGRKSPTILQYVLENGKAKKADEYNLENLEENQKLLIIYQCPDCSIHFSKFFQYEKHNCPKAQNVYRCTKCDSTFNNTKAMSAHMKQHRLERGPPADNQGPHICEVCNTEFPSYKSLRLHRRMHDPIKEREIEPPVSYGIMGEDLSPKESTREMFECEICNNTYDKQYEEAHMRSHVEEEKFDCRVCNRKFFSQTNLDMHMRVHTKGKKFSCEHCKKNFLTNEALQEHISNKCVGHKKLYECQYCGRRFVRPHEKVKHERIHTGEKPHVCKICKKAFRVSYCLTLHLRTHSGNRPYVCATCGKRFKAHSVYNHHLLIHSNERNYKCPYCPKSFKTGVQLAGHKNSHTKPFTCTECNRPFASLYAVRAHMESHYRENNLKYHCAECGASYARAFALRDHIKAHHPNASEKSVTESTTVLQDYEMATEGMNASNNILPVDETVLVQYEQAEGVEVEEAKLQEA